MLGVKAPERRLETLLVDANLGDVAAAKATLKGTRFSLDVTNNVGSAISKLGHKHYDCVMVDSDLMSGEIVPGDVARATGDSALVILSHSERPLNETALPGGAVFLAVSQMRSLQLTSLIEDAVAVGAAMRGGLIDAVMVPNSGIMYPRFQSNDDGIYRGLIDALRNGIITTDDEGRVVFTNVSTGQILGCNADDLLGLRLVDLASDKAMLISKAKSAELGVPGRLELDLTAPGGKPVHVLAEVVAWTLQSGHSGFCLTITDLRREKELRDELQSLAVTDPLTGIHNRRYLATEMKTELQRARRYKRPLTCLMMDIDGFKDVNDTYGHITGDTLLRLVASRIKESVRETDILARYGGDEFCAILVETPLEGGLNVAERIRQTVQGIRLEADPADRSGMIRATISIGVYTPQREDEFSLNAIVGGADAELTRAKAAGKNCVLPVRAVDEQSRTQPATNGSAQKAHENGLRGSAPR